MKLKPAFTMIELIFVIVIIGILAAVAIPKLAATRDDAKVSVTAKHISDASSEIVSYVLSQSIVENDISDMSNVVKSMIAIDEATKVDNKTINVKMGSINDCAILKIVTNTNGALLTLTFTSDSSDNQCNDLKNTIQSIKYPMSLSGSTIIR